MSATRRSTHTPQRWGRCPVAERPWTPGPWISDEEEGTPFVAWKKPAPSHAYQMVAVMSLCTVNGISAGQTEMRNNATLIATAPELYEALAALYQECSQPSVNTFPPAWHEAMNRADAALAKALPAEVRS